MFACIHSRASDSRHALLVDCAYGFSPRAEETSPDTVIADLAGCEHLFGGEEQVAKKMARRAAVLGLDASVAVAANPDAAICAAHGLPGTTVIAEGREAEALASLPLSALASFASVHSSLSEWNEIYETLHSWGIRTLGQLAALPQDGLSERLGSEGGRLLELARGACRRTLVPAIPPPGFEKSLELEYPVVLLEPLLFIVASLLNQLCRNLEERALATNEITIRLKLDSDQNGDPGVPDARFPARRGGCEGAEPDLPQSTQSSQKNYAQSTSVLSMGSGVHPAPGNEHERVLRLPVPMLNSQAFLRLLRLDLEQHPPRAAVVGVWVRTKPAKPRPLQGGLFIPLAPEPQKLELTLARIAKLVGAENAGSPELLDTHRPATFQINRFEVRGPSEVKRAGEPSSSSHLAPRTSHLGFRHFRPPLAAHVETVSEHPARLAARGIGGRVVSQAGPWRASGDWWSPSEWHRDEWDVALADGSLYRIYFDCAAGGWYVDGSYD